MGDDLNEKLVGWLESSGRALELRISRAARRSRAKVDQSWTYTDSETGKVREGDVLATFGWEGLEQRRMDLHAVVECKSSTKHPWVAFYDRVVSPSTELANWTLYAHGPFVGLTEPLVDIWLGCPPFTGSRAATHIATALDGKDAAGDAIRQVMSQARGLWNDHLKLTGRGSQGGGAVIVAAVVTSCPLFTAELDKDGEIKLEQVPQVQVRTRGQNGAQSRVWVMNEEPARQFFVDLRDRANDAAVQAGMGRG